jgi:hypothetical protein
MPHFGGRKMDAVVGIALIVIGLALVCGALIFQRRILEPDEESSQGRSGKIPKSLDPALLEDLRRLNEMEAGDAQRARDR